VHSVDAEVMMQGTRRFRRFALNASGVEEVVFLCHEDIRDWEVQPGYDYEKIGGPGVRPGYACSQITADEFDPSKLLPGSSSIKSVDNCKTHINQNYDKYQEKGEYHFQTRSACYKFTRHQVPTGFDSSKLVPDSESITTIKDCCKHISNNYEKYQEEEYHFKTKQGYYKLTRRKPPEPVELGIVENMVLNPGRLQHQMKEAAANSNWRPSNLSGGSCAPLWTSAWSTVTEMLQDAAEFQAIRLCGTDSPLITLMIKQIHKQLNIRTELIPNLKRLIELQGATCRAEHCMLDEGDETNLKKEYMDDAMEKWKEKAEMRWNAIKSPDTSLEEILALKQKAKNPEQALTEEEAMRVNLAYARSLFGGLDEMPQLKKLIEKIEALKVENESIQELCDNDELYKQCNTVLQAMLEPPKQKRLREAPQYKERFKNLCLLRDPNYSSVDQRVAASELYQTNTTDNRTCIDKLCNPAGELRVLQNMLKAYGFRDPFDFDTTVTLGDDKIAAISAEVHAWKRLKEGESTKAEKPVAQKAISASETILANNLLVWPKKHCPQGTSRDQARKLKQYRLEKACFTFGEKKKYNINMLEMFGEPSHAKLVRHAEFSKQIVALMAPQPAREAGAPAEMGGTQANSTVDAQHGGRAKLQEDAFAKSVPQPTNTTNRASNKPPTAESIAGVHVRSGETLGRRLKRIGAQPVNEFVDNAPARGIQSAQEVTINQTNDTYVLDQLQLDPSKRAELEERQSQRRKSAGGCRRRKQQQL
jgi:hypothetical protein